MALPTIPINTPVVPSRNTVYYCDPGDLQRRISTEGVKLRLEDFGEGSLSGESGAIEDAIWDATELINSFCYSLYRPEDLKTSIYINRRCVDLVIWYLYTRRGNIPTGSIQQRYQETLKWLEEIHTQKLEIPGVPVRWTQAPAWSNIRIDQRYPTFRIRVERSVSDKFAPTPYQQSVDWQSEYDYSITIFGLIALSSLIYSFSAGIFNFIC